MYKKKSWWERLWCAHYYVEEYMWSGWPDPHYMYRCTKCGKERIARNQPINYIE